METIKIIGITIQTSKNYLIVADGQEAIRVDAQEIGSFKEEAESFVRKKYGEHLDIQDVTIDFQSEDQGAAWVEISPRTDGILNSIAEDYGITIVKTE